VGDVVSSVVVDVARRRQRLRRLLAAVQSSVQPARRGVAAAAAVALTTARDADPFVAASRAMAFASTPGRARRSVLRQGIVCECCVHHCELGELQGYCSSTPAD